MTEMTIEKPDDAPLARHPVLFFGQAGEYFSIWIVNIALSIATLGIYSAWAKVRTKRYFYGNTEIAGHRFDYTAEPIQILKGRAIAFVFFIVVSNLQNFNPVLGLVGSLVIMVALPFIIVLSMRFNMAKTVYRNVPFRFVGGFGEAAIIIFLVPGMAMMSLGLLAPLAAKMSNEFIYKNIRYGDRHIALDLPVRALYGVYGKALAVCILILIPAAIIGSIAGPGATPIVIFATIYILILVFGSIVSTQILNMCFNYGLLDGKHRFESTMSPWKVLEIRITNALAIIASLGMLFAWAQIRFTNYRTSCTAVHIKGDPDANARDIDTTTKATGEGFADFIDFDLGF